MKAIICTKYGPPEVLQLAEVAKPTPKKNELLIKIHATAVTGSDVIIRSFKLSRWSFLGFMMGLILGFRKPRNPIIGMVLSGEVEAVGSAVKHFKLGDQVYGFTIKPPRIRFGAYAEYICLHEDGVLSLKPTNATHEEAVAMIYGSALGLYFLRKAGIENAKKVLIYGASGSIGTSSVQLARYYGAEVTGVCSTRNLEMVKSLGASTVIDYTNEDFANTTECYDLILDAVPNGKVDRKSLKQKCQKLLAPNGQYISVDDGSPSFTADDLILFKELAEAGKLKAVIDTIYPLEQIVEAHRHVDTGHKKGNVVITVAGENS